MKHKSAGLVVLEMLFITAAVVLGFAVTEWGENRRHEERGRMALAAIERELEANLAAVSEILHSYWKKDSAVDIYFSGRILTFVFVCV